MKPQDATLSTYERSILRGVRGSTVDLNTSSKRTQAIVNAMLGSAHIDKAVVLEDGTTVVPTIEELLIAKAIEKELANPKGLETIERLMKIRGELDDKSTVINNISLVDQDLAERAIK